MIVLRVVLMMGAAAIAVASGTNLLFAILSLYLLFVSRGFRIGFTGQDDFGRLLGVGLSFVVALGTGLRIATGDADAVL